MKQSYQTWLWQILGDIKRLTNRESIPGIKDWRIEQSWGDRFMGLVAVRNTIASRIHAAGGAWLKPLIDEGVKKFSLLEVLCVHRYPFKREKGHRWFDQAAVGLFAYPGWVEFTSLLLNPTPVSYHPKIYSVYYLGGRVWEYLTGWKPASARGHWAATHMKASQYGGTDYDFWKRVNIDTLGL